MAVALVVPWRPSDEHRVAAWSWIRSRLATEHPTWEIVEGSCDGGPWVKAEAVRDALSRTDAARLVIHDADVYTDGLTRAVEALGSFPWAIPHHTLYRLTEQATQNVYDGQSFAGPFTQHPYKGYAGGGVLCLDRATYERVPIDPRFQGWGGEDEAWHLALRRLAGGGFRGRADLWHLFHEPQQRIRRQVGSEESAQLLNRYQRARTPTLMADLIAEVTDGERPHRAQPQGCT